MKPVAVPHSAVKPLHTASDAAMTLLRLVRSASIAKRDGEHRIKDGEGDARDRPELGIVELEVFHDRPGEDAEDLPVEEIEDVGQQQEGEDDVGVRGSTLLNHGPALSLCGPGPAGGTGRPVLPSAPCRPRSELVAERQEDLARIAVECGHHAFAAKAGDDVARRRCASGTPVTGLAARNW